MMEKMEELQIQTEFNVQKVLWFSLGQEDYGVKVEYVQSVIDSAPGTPVPNTPRFVREVVNLRGTLVPIVSIREMFDLPPAENGGEGTMVILKVDTMMVGILVDGVSDVLDIDFSSLQPPPPSLSAFGAECIMGIHRHPAGILTILDIYRIVNIAKEMISKYS
ncbi:MAG: chemotaxis protein CheW [bacterium]